MPVTAGGTTSGKVISARSKRVAAAVAVEQQRQRHAQHQLQRQGDAV